MIASRGDEAALRPGVFDGGGAIVFNMLRPAAICVAALILCAGPAQAEYKAGRAAWDAGRHGEAVTQWRAAARAQDVRAMLALGRAFAKGVGVPQDFIEAHKWLNLAAGRGSAEGAAERDALAKEMTAGERAEARRLARAWRIAAARPETKPKPAAPAGKAERPKKPAPAAPPPKHALREAQGLLARLGYKPGPADGIWRPESAQAYRAFLDKAGLAPGDVLTPAGLRALRRAAKDKTPAARTAGQSLHRAVQAGDIDGLKAALKAGANANARDRRGWTALMHAANRGQTLMVAPLLAAKADPDVRAADGATALFMAAAHGNTEIVVQLMKAGVDISLKGPKGRTAAGIARLRYGTVATARKKGADLALLALLAGKTWAEVASSPEAMEAALALTSRERRLIQTGLASAGFKPGPADGVFGPATRAAIRAWQKQKDRTVTGWLTPAGAGILGAAGEKKKRAEAHRAEAERRKIEREQNARKKELENLAGFIRKSLYQCGSFKYAHSRMVHQLKYDRVTISGASIKFTRSYSTQVPGRVGGIRHVRKSSERLSGAIKLDEVNYLTSGVKKSTRILKYFGGGSLEVWYVHFGGPKGLVYMDSHTSSTSKALNGRRAGIWNKPLTFDYKYNGSAWLYVCNEKTASAIHSRMKSYLEKKKARTKK